MRTISLLSRGALMLSGILVIFGCTKPGAAEGLMKATIMTTQAPQSPEDKMPRIKVDEAKKLVETGKAVLIDVRGTEAYKRGHIKGALDVPLTRLESGDYKGLPKDKRIIAYCTCGAEQSSARAALLLDKGGFKEASALLGGMHAWETAGGELEKSPEGKAQN